jgi:alpha-L-fucosidase
MPSLDWFQEARFGLFVHFGAYTVGQRGEWVLYRERIPQDEYLERFCRRFNPERFDARELVKLAQAAGMRYLVFPARHHDGYCLWKTATTARNSVEMGPGRDLCREVADACHAAEFPFGWYLSAADWLHPDYPDAYARDWPTAWSSADAQKRSVDFVLRQVEEILTQYGEVAFLWWDGCLPAPFDPEGIINRRAKELQPGLLINERNGEPYDYRITEQSTKAKEGAWEACLTLNDSWCYHPGDTNWKAPKQVVQRLLSIAGQGGNLLLNVGPKPDGSLPVEAVEILTRVGRWLEPRRAWLPHSGRTPFGWSVSHMTTVKGNVLYLHNLFGGQFEICYAEIANQVERVRLLSTGADLPFEQRKDGRLLIRGVPEAVEDDICTTLEITCAGPPRPLNAQETFWIPG